LGLRGNHCKIIIADYFSCYAKNRFLEQKLILTGRSLFYVFFNRHFWKKICKFFLCFITTLVEHYSKNLVYFEGLGGVEEKKVSILRALNVQSPFILKNGAENKST